MLGSNWRRFSETAWTNGLATLHQNTGEYLVFSNLRNTLKQSILHIPQAKKQAAQLDSDTSSLFEFLLLDLLLIFIDKGRQK